MALVGKIIQETGGRPMVHPKAWHYVFCQECDEANEVIGGTDLRPSDRKARKEVEALARELRSLLKRIGK